MTEELSGLEFDAAATQMDPPPAARAQSPRPLIGIRLTLWSVSGSNSSSACGDPGPMPPLVPHVITQTPPSPTEIANAPDRLSFPRRTDSGRCAPGRITFNRPTPAWPVFAHGALSPKAIAPVSPFSCHERTG